MATQRRRRPGRHAGAWPVVGKGSTRPEWPSSRRTIDVELARESLRRDLRIGAGGDVASERGGVFPNGVEAARAGLAFFTSSR